MVEITVGKVMNNLSQKMTIFPRKHLLLFSMLLTLALSGCSTIETTMMFEPPPFDHHGPAVQITDPDILALSEAMQNYVEKYILPYENTDTRRDLLSISVAENGVLGFQYDDTSKLTAAEAFRRRSCNCISHANIVLAMAIYAVLEAH
ncbi:MAG: hypothetical protein KJO35_06820, partial [Gammaproteobacteria bacterium]|nr:hypothetical protein [Gammaproteobacteria bacterium]